MTSRSVVLWLTLATTALSSSRAQTWTRDANVHPVFKNDVSTVQSVQYTAAADGRIFIHGDFSHLSGGAVAASEMAFLKADGTPDPTFIAAVNDSDWIPSAVPLADGRVLAIRYVSNAVRLERYTKSGQLDTTFTSIRMSGWEMVTPLADGRILVSSPYEVSRDLGRTWLTRLTGAGVIDPTFTPALPARINAVTAVAIGPDGKLTVSAAVSTPTAASVPVLFRLGPDGAADPTFAAPTLPDSLAQLVVQPDGKVLGRSATTLTRYNVDGSVDSTFAPAISDLRAVGQFGLGADGTIVVQAYAGKTVSMPPATVYILSATGAILRDCRTLFEAGHAVELGCVAADNSLWLIHGFPLQEQVDPGSLVPSVPITPAPLTLAARTAALVSEVRPTVPVVAPIRTNFFAAALARVTSDGAAMTPLTPDPIRRSSGSLAMGTLDASNRMVVQGWFTSVDGQSRSQLARFTSDGVLDSSFIPSLGNIPLGGIAVVAADGSIVAPIRGAGQANSDGYYSSAFQLVRLDTNGRLDPRFQVDPNLGSQIKCHAVAADGRVLVSFFTPNNDDAENLRLGWLDATGKLASTLPTRFGGLEAVIAAPTVALAGTPPSPKVNASIYANPLQQVYLYPSGKVILTGMFGTVNGQPAQRVARLNRDGSLDTSFQPDVSGLAKGYWPAVDSAGHVSVNGQIIQNGKLVSVSFRFLESGQRDPYFSIPGLNRLSPLRQENGFPDLNFPTTTTGPDGSNWTIDGVLVGGDGTVWTTFPLARFTASDTQAITVAPTDRSAIQGRDTTFLVGLGTRHTATYQWTHEGRPVPGATLPYLTLTNIQPAQAGRYGVIVAVDGQVLSSRDASLTVLEGSAGLVNFSGRAYVGAKATPVAGFVLAGDGSQRDWLLRAMGPSLLQFGLNSIVIEPELTLFTGATSIAHDRGGASGSAALAMAKQVGAFPPSVGSWFGLPREAALVMALAPGAYTALATSPAGSSGIVLLEVYDSVRDAKSGSLRNVSLRSVTGAGADVATIGFVISGNTPLKLLVRGVGPALTAFGVSSVVPDPVLSVYSPEAGKIVANAGWADDPLIADTGRRVGAFGLPVGSRDAAVGLTLEPGAYTAQLSSASGASGEVMIEVYVVDR